MTVSAQPDLASTDEVLSAHAPGLSPGFAAVLVDYGMEQECRMRTAGGPRLGERIDQMWDELFS